MKIVLVNSPITPGIPAKFSTLPLGILHMGTYLDSMGYDVVIIDANLWGLTAEEIVEKIFKYNPDWIGFSCMTDTLRITIDSINLAKKRQASIKIVVGGAHVNATHEEFFEYECNVDYLIRGEGEISFHELLKNEPENYDRVPGLIYKDNNGNIRKNPPAEFIKDLDILPWIDYELIETFDIGNYVSPIADRKPEYSMIVSRGCPYRCAFCNVKNTFGRRYRVRSVESTISEIKDKMARYGVRYLNMKDSTFTINKNWVREFCERLLQEGIDVHWRCNTRVDLVEKDLFGLMRRAGCQCLTLGIESGSQQILDILKKDITLKQIHEGTSILKKLGFILHCTFIIGSPGETKESIKKTIGLAKKIRPLFCQFCAATAYPDNYFYDWGLDTGALKNPKWYLSGKYKNEALYGFDTEFEGTLKFKEFDVHKEEKGAYNGYYLSFWFLIAFLQTFFRNPIYLTKLVLIAGFSFLKALFSRK